MGAVWSAALGWLTPAVLFVAMNLVIATIAVASRLMSSSSSGGDDGDQAIPGEPRGPLLRAPSFLAVDRLRSSFSFSRLGLAADHAQAQTQPRLLSGNDDEVPEPEPSPQQHAAEGAEAEHQREEAGRVERSRSEAAAALEAAPNSQRRRRPRAPRAVAEELLDGGHSGEEAAAVAVEVDARADDFIRRFREQLRLQRLDSILRYRDHRDSLRRTGTA